MLFLVDGYNVTMADSDTRRLTRDDQREALVSRLATRLPELLGAGRAVVFFDGGPGEGPAEESRGPVEVRYSRAGIADDAIVSAAAGAREPVTLVSSDRELRDRVRAAAANEVVVLGASALFTGGRPARPRRGRGMRRDVGTPSEANRINEELKRLWGIGEQESEGEE